MEYINSLLMLFILLTINLYAGEWGLYDGLRDADGKRQGLGKMKYDSGNVYEGPFLNDKYHGEKGSYKWQDGDEYLGEWKFGERNGVGIYNTTNGFTSYSIYENGNATGEGVEWSADRKIVYQLMNGDRLMEILPEDGESFAKTKFKLPVPEPYYASTSVGAKKSGILGRFFKTKDISADGKPMFKDNGKTLIALIVFVTSLQLSQFTIQYALRGMGVLRR